MSNFKKSFSVAVSALTVVWSMGIAAVPFASAAVSAGTLVKQPGVSAVYYVGSDMKRYVFPHQNVYRTWYKDFSGVQTVSQSDLQAMPLGGNVTTRPGTYLVKVTSIPKVYAVEPYGVLRHISSEAIATQLYGANWTSLVRDVDDNLWVNYTEGTAITSAVHPTGALIKYANSTTWYYVDGGSRRPFASDAAIMANMIDSSFGITTTISYPDGASITAKEDKIAYVAKVGQGPVSTGSGLSVAVASDSPAAITLASGSAYNPVLKLNLTAGNDGQVLVTQIKVTKSGFVANSNVSGIGIFGANNRRYGNIVTSLGADGVALMNLVSDPITVAAGQTVPIWVKANLCLYNGCTGSTTYSGTVAFSVNSAADVTAGGATVSGTFPAMGNTMNIVNGASSLAGITVDEQPINASGITLNVDAASIQEISKFSIQETSSNEAVKLYGLRLYNNGTASDSDLKDVQLVDQTFTVLATSAVSSKGVFFDLSSNPYLIDKGQIKYFTIKAKIVDGAARTVQFTVYNDYDVDIRGLSTMSGILPVAGSNDTSFPIGDSTSTYNKVTIGSGTLTMSRSSGSSSNAVVPGATNVVLGSFDVQANGEDMELRKVSFGLDQNTGSVNLTGTVYVKVDGATVYSAAASTFAAAGTANSITLSSYPILKSGVKSIATIEVSISSSAVSGDAYFVNAFDVTQVKRVITNDLLDPTVGTVQGLTRAVQTAAIKVSTLSSPVTSSVVAGTNNFELARFELNAQTSGEDVRVSGITVTDTLGSGTDYSGVNNLWMYNAADSTKTQIQTSSSTSTNANTVAFNFSSPIVVSVSSPVTLVLLGNVVSSTGVSQTYKVANTTSHVTATGKDTGNSITTPTFGSGTGQTMTVVAGGTLTGSLVTGTGSTPSVAQLVNVGTSGGTFFAFKLTAQYESQKVTTLNLHATGTALNQNDLVNIALYRQVGSAAIDSTPFATTSQFGTCGSNACDHTWTATDNLLAAEIVPGTPVTIYAKANIGSEGTSKLADDFYMSLDMTSGNDIVAKGTQTAAAPTYAGGFLNNSSTAKSHIVPFGVVVSAFEPTSSVTQTIVAGTAIGRFKIQNNGSAQVTLTDATFADNGSHTGTSSAYTVYASSENSSDYLTNSLEVSGSDTLAFGSLSATTTINGGSYRYLTITLSTLGGVVTGNSFSLSVSALGNLKYSVAEAALGYDGEQDGDLTGTIASLYVDGKPSLGTMTKQ